MRLGLSGSRHLRAGMTGMRMAPTIDAARLPSRLVGEGGGRAAPSSTFRRLRGME